MHNTRTARILFLIISCLVLCAIAYYPFWASQKAYFNTLRQVSIRLKTASDWEAIKHHIYCVILEPGRTSATVEADLQRISDFPIEKSASEAYSHSYRFAEDELRAVIYSVSVRYNSSGLIEEAWLLENMGPMASPLPKQFNCNPISTPAT